MTDNVSGRDFAASGFFVARTPLLPFEDFEAWGAGLEAPEVDSGDSAAMARAIAADRERLRARLMERLERPEIREALYVASPSLFEAFERWRRKPEGRKGARVERALVRYLARMATRATPFGLFSGCSAGTVRPEAGATRLRLEPRTSYRRHTRLDMDCLSALCESLAARPELRPALIHRPNSSLYAAAGRLRYAESVRSGTARAYRLMALEASPFIEGTLARAGAGALAEELASAVVAADPEISLEEARPFVGELIESQILVPDLAPRVTGPDAVPDLASLLRLAGNPGAEAFDRLAQGLARLDEAGLGNEPDTYRDLIRGLESDFVLEVDPSRFVQIDMVKPAREAVLGGAVIEELVRGIGILHRLSPRSSDPFDRFREAFETRFGDRREVPLMEVLDEEAGIGFRPPGEPAEGSPLLAGLAFPAAPGGTIVWDQREQHLQRLVQEAVARGERRIDLRPADLEVLSNPAPAPLPDALHVLVRVAALSAEALRQGRFQVHLVNAAGPSGARLLGRFCHMDESILNGVRAHVEEEERLRPDAVFAEIVHLQEGRLGNILARPVLRRYEIPFLCRAAVDPEHRIPVSDLRVSVVSGRIVLTSERLGREVIPRLTTAHNYYLGSLGVYRFLCALQSQGMLGSLYWQWGPLQTAPFLPRVTCGRLVLERARWDVSGPEIRELARWKGPDLLRELRRWRDRRGLPRCVALVESDNELPVDFENIVSIESFLDEAQGRPAVTLQELFPGPEDLWVEGPEGRFVQELIVPFVRRGPASESRPPRREAPSAAVRRDFPPGSEWLFAKLYTGTATADAVLRETVAPVVRQALASGDADAWFFIRYGDPDWHLRVRLHGDPESLHGRVLPVLQREAAALLDRRLIWRIQLDTYQREVSRYGGPEAIWPVERLFWADSEAALGIVEVLEGERAAGERWRLAVRGIDLLLSDLGFDLPGKVRVAAAMRESYTRELRAGPRLKQQLGARHRELREEVARLLQPVWDDRDSLAPGFEALDRRSRLSAPALADLLALESSGRLFVSRGELALSLIHMHVNRLLRAEGRQHELVLAEILFRHYTAQAARGGTEESRHKR